MKILTTLLFLFVLVFSNAQTQKETIYLDGDSMVITVIYKPTKSDYFSKKIAVYAKDTSKIAFEKNYLKNYQNGLTTYYYTNGKPMVKAVYANNKLNGEWTYYNPSGFIIIKGVYKEGIKHGYWAYKEMGCYGKYKNGVRVGKWYCLDAKKIKHVAFYEKDGSLKTQKNNDEFVTSLLQNSYKKEITENTLPDENTSANQSKTTKQESIKDDGLKLCYLQAIDYLSSNFVLQKQLKAHYCKDNIERRKFKQHFVKDKFQFFIDDNIYPLDITPFIQESNENKLGIPLIDSLLKLNGEKVVQSIKNASIAPFPFPELKINNPNAKFRVMMSGLHEGFMRIDLIKYDTLPENNGPVPNNLLNENQLFRILLYFDKNNVLKAAAYEHRNIHQ
jgi:hypothetical protein